MQTKSMPTYSPSFRSLVELQRRDKFPRPFVVGDGREDSLSSRIESEPYFPASNCFHGYPTSLTA
ncbi:MAG TPA: hypothetical protein VNX88_00005, partial [Terriglobales bacterium]|nr:hypothetical protein [Terriglobales bacterium]